MHCPDNDISCPVCGDVPERQGTGCDGVTFRCRECRLHFTIDIDGGSLTTLDEDEQHDEYAEAQEAGRL
jgi:hypothetical protein